MLQVVSYNIGGARRLRKPPHNPVKAGGEAAITLMVSLDHNAPTFIALQETGYIIWENKHISSAHDALCDSINPFMYYYARFAYEVNSDLHPHGNLWNRPEYEGARFAAEGNGFATNMDFSPWDWEIFEHDYDYWTHTQISRAALYSTGDRDTQPRNAMIASIEHLDYGPLYFINTHFGTVTGEVRGDMSHERTQLGEQMRLHQAEEILRITAELREAERTAGKPARPIILAGDFNAQPDAPCMQALQRDYSLLMVDNPPDERWTHVKHRQWIDHILVSDPRGVLPVPSVFIQTELPFDDLTDHRPVIAVFGDSAR